jgi:hypothetical protein
MFGARTWKFIVLLILDIPVFTYINCKHMHTCPDSWCIIPVSHLNPCPRVRNRATFLMTLLLITSPIIPAEQMCTYIITVLSGKANQLWSATDFLNNSKGLAVCLLQTAWCLNLKSMAQIIYVRLYKKDVGLGCLRGVLATPNNKWGSHIFTN